MPLKFSPPILALAMLLLAASAQAQGFPPRPPGSVDYPPPDAPQPYPGPQQYPGQQQYPPQQYPSQGQNQRQDPRQDPRGVQSQPLPPPPFERQNTKRSPPPKAPDAAGPPPAAPKSKAKAKQAAPAPSGDAPEAAEVPVEQAPIPRISNPTAVFSGLDKITGRIITFEAAIDETVQFGALQVTPRACYTRPATEIQNTTSFAEVDEITLAGDIKRIFTGWMFANSPGLHAVEHPIYDVWIKDCKTTPPAVADSGKKE